MESVIDSYFWETFSRTLALGAAVATLATILGALAAWLVERTDLPGASRWARLLALPYSIPGYLIGMAAIATANALGASVYGFWGMALIESAVAFAFPYLEVRATLSKIDPALEEAARMAGAGPARILRRVTLPLALPSIGNGWILAFLYAVSSFGVPALIGLPARKPVLTTWIYSSLRMGGPQGLREAAAVSAILLLICGILLAVAARLRSRARWVSGGQRSNRPTRTRLGSVARIQAFGGVLLFFALASVLPWIALLLSALAPVAGDFSPTLWTLRNFKYVIFELPDFAQGFLHSVSLAALATAVVLAGGFLLAFVSLPGGVSRRKSVVAAVGRAVSALAGVAFAVPGSTLAVGLILLLGTLGLSPSALVVLLVAYLLKYFALGARPIAEAFRSTHPSFDEAARIAGASPFRRAAAIWLPLLRPHLAASAQLVFFPILTEVTMSVLLAGPGEGTLGTALFHLQEYADQPSASAMAWLLLTAALAGALASGKADR